MNRSKTDSQPRAFLPDPPPQGALIGLGAVLPGISGGVLCVVFGIYRPVMELLSSPFKRFRTHVPKLLPVIIGAAVDFWNRQSAGIFPGEISGPVGVCVYRSDCRNAAVSYAGSRTGGPQRRLLDLHGDRVPCDHPASDHAERVERRDPAQHRMVCVLRVLPGAQYYRAGDEFLHTAYASGALYAFCRRSGAPDLQVLGASGVGAVVTVICLARGVDTLFQRHYSYDSTRSLGL